MIKIKNQVVEENLEILIDKKSDGKERPWKMKKIYNELLRDSYNRIGYERKAVRANECSSYLEFKVFEDGKMKLANANFCQIRLCALCSWRRELKIFSQLSKIVEQLEKDKYRFILLTLTCDNVIGADLISKMDSLFSSFKRLFELKQVKKSIKGYFRALEITHDTELRITKQMYKKSKDYYDSKFLKVGDLNPNYNKYHPHFHVMIVVNEHYFKVKDYYIKQSDWVQMWKQSMRVDYTPVVDVRAIRNTDNKGVKEVSKYTIKDTDFILKEDKHLTDETVKILDDALAYRRLIAYGGIMKDLHRKLNFKEDVSADINIDGDEEIIDVPYILKRFKWHIGYKNYVLEESKY